MTVEVYIELSKLKSLYTGLGQFCLYLGNEIEKLKDEGFKPTFLIPEGKQNLLPVTSHTKVINDWHRSNLPLPVRRLSSRSIGDCELWHVCSQDSRFWPSNKNASVIFTIHDLNFLRQGDDQKIARRIRRLQEQVDRAAVITTISEFSASEIHHYLDLKGKPLKIIYNGCKKALDEALHTPNYELENEPFLFTIGDITEKKNFHVLLDFVDKLQHRKLVISGNDKTKYGQVIRKLITHKGLESQVILTGVISDGEREWLYKNSEAFLFPSLSEGFGLPVIEAMKYGKPVFVSRRTSLPEIVGDDGFYFDSFDPDDMVKVFVEGMKLFGSSAEKSAAVKKRAGQFKWSLAAEQYVSVYKELTREINVIKV